MNYGRVLCQGDPTLDDLREAVNTMEDAARTARRFLGGAHPLVANFEFALRNARNILVAHETLPA